MSRKQVMSEKKPRAAKKSAIVDAFHKEGQAAFLSGLSDNDCPYPIGSSLDGSRRSWLSGFFDEKIKQKLGSFFARHGVEYP